MRPESRVTASRGKGSGVDRSGAWCLVVLGGLCFRAHGLVHGERLGALMKRRHVLRSPPVRKMPLASDFEPWSPKPWPISWPITPQLQIPQMQQNRTLQGLKIGVPARIWPGLACSRAFPGPFYASARSQICFSDPKFRYRPRPSANCLLRFFISLSVGPAA